MRRWFNVSVLVVTIFRSVEYPHPFFSMVWAPIVSFPFYFLGSSFPVGFFFFQPHFKSFSEVFSVLFFLSCLVFSCCQRVPSSEPLFWLSKQQFLLVHLMGCPILLRMTTFIYIFSQGHQLISRIVCACIFIFVVKKLDIIYEFSILCVTDPLGCTPNH